MEALILILLWLLYIILDYLYRKSTSGKVRVSEPEKISRTFDDSHIIEASDLSDIADDHIRNIQDIIDSNANSIDFKEKRKFYLEYLASDKWKLLRQFVFELRDGKCEQCGKQFKSHKESYHCHHVSYERLGSEKLSDLSLLCNECHTKVHKFHPKNNKFYPLLTKEQFNDMSAD